ncbi:MAG: hypothetical protein KatS3mg052_0560 [Candidatus Roseilinea sp.]|nr:MAG: hypothetical protein KatS3mg052_0560 [Candidatus Roseilinea sp.]
MVSVIANALMFTLQERDPLRAGVWSLLAPVFSHRQAAPVLGEPIRAFDVGGAALVVAGRVISGVVDVRRALTAQRASPPR